MNIVDDFVDRLADEVGVQLSLDEPSPLIDRFVDALLSDDVGKWITIGGKQKGDEKHAGGFRVQIDGDGKIIKGRLKGTNVKDVKKRFDEGKNRGEPIREKEESSKLPNFMKKVKNTVDNSRKDDKISPVEQQTSGKKGAEMYQEIVGMLKGKNAKEGKEAAYKAIESLTTYNSSLERRVVPPEKMELAKKIDDDLQAEFGEKTSPRYFQDDSPEMGVFYFRHQLHHAMKKIMPRQEKDQIINSVKKMKGGIKFEFESNPEGVWLKLSDKKTGNNVLKHVKDVSDAEKTAKEAMAEMKKRQMATRSAMRAESEE